MIITGLVMLLKNKKFLFGFSSMTLLIFISVVGTLVIPAEYARLMSFEPGLAPSVSHILGTDGYGRDVFAVVVFGTLQSLYIGAMAGTIGTVVSVIVGFTSGYKRGKIDVLLRNITNVFLVIPTWPLIVIISIMVRTISIPQMAIILAAFSWPWAARTLRSQVLAYRTLPFVEVAKVSGETDFDIAFKEILPNILPYIGSGFCYAFTGAMLAEVSLEVIGLSPPGAITLGMILHLAISSGAMSHGYFWWIFPPPAILVIVFVSLQMINIGMDEIYNPRLRK